MLKNQGSFQKKMPGHKKFHKVFTVGTKKLPSQRGQPMQQTSENTDSKGIPRKPQTDEELYHAFHDRREPAFMGELYKRYLHLVFGVCYKYLKDEEAARDAAMQVFEQLLTKPSTREIKSFKDWLFIITRNFCLMELRHEKAGKRAIAQTMYDLQSEVMESSSIMHLYDAQEQERRFVRLRAALARLPDEQRKCVELYYYEEKSYQDISEQTGYDLNKVKSYLQNGKRNLKIFLDHGKE
ncbi:MAG: sigma-70 family RNA polymerase sigma factor [Bacteroidetes bacterium]|nr:sigma-70 family RNA polymerase sigma factor [Bacteroidota bacterium]